jgi:hypothetical protein
LQQGVYLILTDFQFLGARAYASSQFVQIEGFPSSVTFDDHQRLVLDPLITGEAVTARIALAPAPNR